MICKVNKWNVALVAAWADPQNMLRSYGEKFTLSPAEPWRDVNLDGGFPSPSKFMYNMFFTASQTQSCKFVEGIDSDRHRFVHQIEVVESED